MNNILKRLPIKTYLIWYLAGLLFLSSFALGQFERLLTGAIIVCAAEATELIFGYLRSRTWRLSRSAVISGLILALIFDTAAHPSLALFAAVCLVAQKRLFRFGRMRHLMNPAAFSIVLISFIKPVASWWGVSWGIIPLVVVIASAGFILYRIRRANMVLAFLFCYGFLFAINSIFVGVSIERLPAFLGALWFDGTVLFFTSVMLVDPVTAAYPKRSQQIVFGALVAVLAVLIPWFYRFLPFRFMDPLLLALVAGNMVMGLIIIPKLKKG